jgi:hypothetical protein
MEVFERILDVIYCMYLVIVFVSACMYEQGSRLAGPEMQL